jgi:hypothetical protein
MACSRASGPKASFSARTNVTSVIPMKPRRLRRCGSWESHRLCRTFAVEAAARHDDDCAFAGEQTFRPCLAVAECDARPQHVVEPGLQGRRHAEIVYGRADDDGVRSPQFIDQLILALAGGPHHYSFGQPQSEGAQISFLSASPSALISGVLRLSCLNQQDTPSVDPSLPEADLWSAS